MNNKRRNRSNAGSSRSPEQPVEGIFNNHQFLHTSANMVGTEMQIETTDGSRYKGVYSAFSSHFEVVLDFVHIVHSPDNLDVSETRKHLRRLILKPSNIISMQVENVDVNYACGTFQTDTSISKFDRNGAIGEKELQPWDGGGINGGEDIDLSLGNEPGWDPNAMFKLNEEVYGVRSNFDHSLAGYTLPLERSESKNFKEAEAKAQRIANEIERNPSTQSRLDLENGDEEDRYAAVSRPVDGSPPRAEKGKYIPPVRRHPNSFQGRLTPRSSPFPTGRTLPTPPADEPPEINERLEREPPTVIASEDNRNSCSPSSNHPANSPIPQQLPPQQQQLPQPPQHQQQPLPPPPHQPQQGPPAHPRNNNNGNRNKTYIVSSYGYPPQQPRYPPPAHPQMVSHRPMPPGVNQPPMQHGPPPPQPLPIVFAPPLPPNHAHQNQLPPVNAMPQDAQPVQVQQQGLHGMEQPGIRDPSIPHVHLPPHGVPHVHPAVPVVQGYVQREHELELRGHRGVNMRGQAPRVFQPGSKRFPPAQFPPPAPPTARKSRAEEVQELSDFSNNMKLSGEEEVDEKQQDSPPLEQWGKGRSPPSNNSAEDATLKKSTLNPNAKEFVYNPSAKPFTPRPPNTPGPSRPHTPQTPAQQFGYSPGPVPTVMMPTTAYVMQSAAFPHQGQPHRVQMTPRPEITSSQMQVAAATGQPLLAPAPMQRFMAPYPNPPPQPYQQMVRMVPSQGGPMMFHPEGAPHVQYMSPHAPTPHPGGQYPQGQPQQFPTTMLYSIPQATMLQYFQQPHGQPGQQQHVQVIVPSNQ